MKTELYWPGMRVQINENKSAGSEGGKCWCGTWQAEVYNRKK